MPLAPQGSILCWKARLGSTFQIAHKFVNAKIAPKAVFLAFVAPYKQIWI